MNDLSTNLEIIRRNSIIERIQLTLLMLRI